MAVELKEVLIKGNWADEINRYQNELLDMAARLSAIRSGMSALQTTISGSALAEPGDITLIGSGVTFMNSAAVTDFEAAVNSNLPILE